jgi:two-component system LytT family response regulator
MTSNTPLRVVIVDDEEPARLALAETLMRVPDVTIVAQCQNGFEAVKVVAETHPDALLLDVRPSSTASTC